MITRYIDFHEYRGDPTPTPAREIVLFMLYMLALTLAPRHSPGCFWLL